MLSNEEIMNHSTLIIFNLAKFIKHMFDIRYNLEKDCILIIYKTKNYIEK